MNATPDKRRTTRPFRPWVTVVLGAVLLGGFVWIFVFSRTSGTGGACLLHRPYESSVRVLENTLRLEGAIQRFARPAEAAMFDAMGAGSGGAQDEALAAYRELLACEQGLVSDAQKLSLSVRVGILLAEMGRLGEARVHLEGMADGAAGLAKRALGLGYGLRPGPPAEPVGDELAALDALGGGWTIDRLGVRLGRRLEQQQTTERRMDSLHQQGLARLSRLRALAFLQLLFIVPGFAFIVAWLSGRRVRPRLASGLVPAPWSMGRAVAVLVRSGVWGIVAFLSIVTALTVTGMLDPEALGTTIGWATPAVMIPSIILVRRHLFLPHLANGGLMEGLGVDPPQRSLPGLTVNSLMPVAFLLIGTMLLRRALWVIGVQTHFTDVVIEPLLWGGPLDASLITLEVVAWAPVLEEIIFRGVIYATLRRHLRPLWAAPITALLFGVLHLYSLGGFLEVVFGGLIFSLAYERTRSLAPAVAAHAVGNATAVVGSMLLLA